MISTELLDPPRVRGLGRSRKLAVLVNGRPRLDAERLRARVDGRVVMVTGASFGIGEATAVRLAAAGATVLLVARSRETLEALAARIEADGGTAVALPTDLTDEAAVDALVATVTARYGAVDVLVNNAGRSIRRTIAESAGRGHDFRRTMEINYLGPVHLTLGLLPAMRARRSGHLVNVSTVAVRIPPVPRWAAYQASKGAFDVWTRSVAQEVRGDGVRTSTVDMGLVRTRMSAPTRHYAAVPALTPQEAADIVCSAVAGRRRFVGPWWCAPLGLLGRAFRGPVESWLGRSFTLSEATRRRRRAG